MKHVFETAGHWFGLCRKPPVFRALQADIVNLPETALEGSPDGGAGGPGTIRRGIGAALSGTKTLIHNPQLLWFPLLAGLVLAVHLIDAALQSGDDGAVLPLQVLQFDGQPSLQFGDAAFHLSGLLVEAGVEGVDHCLENFLVEGSRCGRRQGNCGRGSLLDGGKASIDLLQPVGCGR